MGKTQKIKLLIILLLVVIILHTFMVPVRVSGNSMDPILKDREFHFYTRIYDKISRNDIIVFHEPIIDSNSYIAIKRVLYIGGDSYWVNIMNIQHCYYSDIEDIRAEYAYECTVPSGYLFVIGENDNSVDTRIYGYISLKNVIGKLWK